MTVNGSGGFSWEDSLPYVLWRAQNAVHRCAQAAIDDLGVTMTQLGLAVHLDEIGPLSASDLSRGFHITPQSVATALSRLDRIGWVERRPHPVHGRVVLYHLSEQGRKGVREGTARMAEVDRRVAGAMPEGSAPAVVCELRRILVELEGGDRPVERLWPVRER